MTMGTSRGKETKESVKSMFSGAVEAIGPSMWQYETWMSYGRETNVAQRHWSRTKGWGLQRADFASSMHMGSHESLSAGRGGSWENTICQSF